MVQLASLYHNSVKSYLAFKVKGSESEKKKKEFPPIPVSFHHTVYYAVFLFVGISLCLIVWLCLTVCPSIPLSVCLSVFRLSKGAAKTTCSQMAVVGHFTLLLLMLLLLLLMMLLLALICCCCCCCCWRWCCCCCCCCWRWFVVVVGIGIDFLLFLLLLLLLLLLLFLLLLLLLPPGRLRIWSRGRGARERGRRERWGER